MFVWPPCCDVLRHVGCCWLKFENGQIWANNTQHVATCRNRVAKRTQHFAPNNVAICWVGMLRSFGRGLRATWLDCLITIGLTVPQNVAKKQNIANCARLSQIHYSTNQQRWSFLLSYQPSQHSIWSISQSDPYHPKNPQIIFHCLKSPETSGRIIK